MDEPAAGAAVRERPIAVDGINSRVLESGAEDASEAVVFVHGNPNSADEWRDLMARTGALARSVAPDMPGFGQADRPRDFSFPVEGFARFLGSALARLGVERAHLVLHDFGGPWGLAWAAAHPDAFASAVVINTGVLIGFEMHRIGKVWGTPVAGEVAMALTSRPAFRAAISGGNPRLALAHIDAMYDDYDRGTRSTVLRLYRSRVDAAVVQAAAKHLRGLDRPALVIWGGKDPFVPVHHAEQQKLAFPSAEVTVLPESGHWPFLEDPEETAAILLPFLEAQLGS